MEHVVVVGAGHSAIQAADSLRSGSFSGALTVIGDDRALPYQRPPLSKDFLADGSTPQPLPLRAERFFAENRITLRRGVTVRAIDRSRRTIVLDDAEELPYSTLVLATGAEKRTVDVPGIGLAGVHELRSLADAERLRRALDTARSVVVVGAGFIGLEFAAAASKRGVNVTVLEAGSRPMERAVTPVMSSFFADAHRRMGTDLRLGEALASLTGRGGSVTAAVGTSGREYPADLLLMGIGVRPRDDLARDSGLATNNGVVVDEHLRTTDPAIYAIGDCANFPTATSARRLRLESIQNATDHGKHVARMILGGSASYTALPWFWTHQGALRLQIAGLTQPGDTAVISGDVDGGRFSVFCFRDERLVAVESLNRPADHMAARRVLATENLPTPDQVADPAFSVRDHVKKFAPDPAPAKELTR